MVKPSPVTAEYHDRQAKERGVRHNDKVWSKWPQKVVIVGWAAKQSRHYRPPPDACQFRMFYCHCLGSVSLDTSFVSSLSPVFTTPVRP